MNRYRVIIAYQDSGVIEKTEFRIECAELDDLKTAFLKRFGNIREAPKSAMEEKPMIKEITYSARNVGEWVDHVNRLTRWGLSIITLSKGDA